MKLSDYIKQLRKEKALSMEELGKRIGVSKAYVSMLENNKNSRSGNPITPSLVIVKALANEGNLSLDELLKLLDDDTVLQIPSPSTAPMTKDKKALTNLVNELSDEQCQALTPIVKLLLKK